MKKTIEEIAVEFNCSVEEIKLAKEKLISNLNNLKHLSETLSEEDHPIVQIRNEKQQT